MNLPEEKFVAKKPSKYDLLKLAVAEILSSSQTYRCDYNGSPDRVHIEVSDWEDFKEKVELLLNE